MICKKKISNICKYEIQFGSTKMIHIVNHTDENQCVNLYPKSVVRKSFLSFSNDRFGVNDNHRL